MPPSPTEFPIVGLPPGVPRSPQTREAGKFRRAGTGTGDSVEGLSAVAVTGPGLEGGPVLTEDHLMQQLLQEQRRTNRYLQLLLHAVSGTYLEVSLSEVA